MTTNPPMLRRLIILLFALLLSLSFGQIQRASLPDMAEILTLRSKIPRDLIVELPDGNQRSMSRCDFVVLNPDAAHIDPEASKQWKNLHRSDFLTISLGFLLFIEACLVLFQTAF